MVIRLTGKNRVCLGIGFAGFLHGERPENRIKTEKTKSLIQNTCMCYGLNTLLNSLFNASRAPSDCSDECIGTLKLDQTKGARQSWSCSMEYSAIVYVYKHHL